jgi:hypothetical protein
MAFILQAQAKAQRQAVANLGFCNTGGVPLLTKRLVASPFGARQCQATLASPAVVTEHTRSKQFIGSASTPETILFIAMDVYSPVIL